MSSYNENIEQTDALESTLAFAGAAAIAAGIWKLFEKSSKVIKDLKDAGNKTEAQRLFTNAYQAAQNGRFLEAVKFLKTSLEKDPTNAHAYNLIAWIYAIHRVELDFALFCANKAISLANNSDDKANFLNTLAEVHAHRGEYNEAVAESLQCLKLVNNNDQIWPAPNACFRLAHCYLIKQEFHNAFDFFKRVLKVDPYNHDHYSNMGNTCIQLEHYNEAKNYYLQAIVVAMQNKEIPDEVRGVFESRCLNDIGVAYYHLGDFDNSWHFHELGYKKCPDNPYPIINLASLAARREDINLMRYYLEKGIPLLVDTRYFQGTAQLIASMLTDCDFEKYKNIVLDMLRNHQKISLTEHKQQMTSWLDRRSHADKSPVNINLEGSSVGAIAVGPHLSLSDVSLSHQTTLAKENEKMNEQKKSGQGIFVEGSTVGVMIQGDEAKVEHVSVGVPLQHPKAEEVKEKIVALKQAIETSDIPSFKKRDALNSLSELRKELEKEDKPERQEGIRYYVGKILDITKNVEPLVNILSSLGRLLGVPI
jgi:tetratricopeptide (TPR) repeat protein